MADIRLIGAQAAANRIGVSRSTVQRLASRGVLTVVHRGEGIRGNLLFAEAEVDAYAAKVNLVTNLHQDAGLDTERQFVAEYLADKVISDVQPTRRDESTSGDKPA